MYICSILLLYDYFKDGNPGSIHNKSVWNTRLQLLDFLPSLHLLLPIKTGLSHTINQATFICLWSAFKNNGAEKKNPLWSTSEQFFGHLNILHILQMGLESPMPPIKCVNLITTIWFKGGGVSGWVNLCSNAITWTPVNDKKGPGPRHFRSDTQSDGRLAYPTGAAVFPPEGFDFLFECKQLA